MSREEAVLLNISEGVAVMTLNYPEKANAFDGEMWLALDRAVKAIILDKKVKAVILTGEGKAFCGGLNLKKVAAEGVNLKKQTLRPGYESLYYLSAVFTALEELPVPVIAAIKGGCIGLGFELALACDIRLASENAVFSIPEVVFGLVPDCGGTQRLPRLIGPAMAKELILSGKRIDAAEALRIGLVNHIFAPEDLFIESEKLAKEIAGHPEEAVQAAKRSINMAMESNLQAGLKFETSTAAAVLGDKLKTMIYSDKQFF